MENNAQEQRIDIADVWQEIKDKWKCIVGFTLVVTLVTTLISFTFAKPVYKYEAMLAVYSNDKTLKECVAVLRKDMGNNTGLAKVETITGLHAARLIFVGQTPEAAKKKADAYLPAVAQKLDGIMNEPARLQRDRNEIQTVKKEIAKLSASLAKNKQLANVQKPLNALLSQVNNIEKRAHIVRTRIVAAPVVETKPMHNSRTMILTAAFVSALLSIVVVLVRFVYRRG